MTAPEAVTNQIAAPAAPSVELNARAAARAESRMLIGGRLVESSSGERFDNVSPATGEVLGSTAAATPADMDAAIASARSALTTRGGRPTSRCDDDACCNCRRRSNAKANTSVKNSSPRPVPLS